VIFASPKRDCRCRKRGVSQTVRFRGPGDGATDSSGQPASLKHRGRRATRSRWKDEAPRRVVCPARVNIGGVHPRRFPHVTRFPSKNAGRSAPKAASDRSSSIWTSRAIQAILVADTRPLPWRWPARGYVRYSPRNRQTSASSWALRRRGTHVGFIPGLIERAG
jgi:hypothetical protein